MAAPEDSDEWVDAELERQLREISLDEDREEEEGALDDGEHRPRLDVRMKAFVNGVRGVHSC